MLQRRWLAVAHEQKFNGDSRQLNNFLERVTLLAQSREVREDELFKSAVELFVGDAFAWYRCIKGTVTNWASLVDRLKKDFLASDADEEIWNQIKSRKQKRGEPVHIFVAHLDTLFNRLSRPPAEVTKVKHIRQNCISEISSHLALSDIPSVNELMNLCRKLEENLNLRSRISNPPQALSAYEADNKQNNHIYGNKNEHNNSNKNKYKFHSSPNKPDNFSTEPKKVTTKSYGNSSRDKPVVCWNCDQVNHTFNNCKLKRKIFCYKCGTKDVKMSSCPTCSKN